MHTKLISSLAHLPLSAVVVALVFTLVLSVENDGSDRIGLKVWTGAIFDDFLGPAGAAPDSKLWGYDLGQGGWGNNELQTYTDSPDNVRLDGQGHLVIEARRTSTGYTSGRLVTRGRADLSYGTMKARIKFPAGQGLLPAFWMLGSSIPSVGWPDCGEIDLMELPNSGNTYNTALHGPWKSQQSEPAWQTATSGPAGMDLTDDFHDYWVNRQPNSIVIGIDGKTLGSYTPTSLPDNARWVFEQPMYALLNIAVGGDWPGAPNDSTRFPATMLVDWFSYTPNS